MNVKTKVDKLKEMSLHHRSKQKPKSISNILCICIFLAFFVISFNYCKYSYEIRSLHYDADAKEVICVYPDGSVYNYLGPWTGLFLIPLVGLGCVILLGKAYENHWKEYNDLIISAQEELTRKKEEEHREYLRRNYFMFESTLGKIVEKYGQPDRKLCINMDSQYDMKSYIMPFSKSGKIIILGDELNFSDIIDAQLADDQKVTKGQITAVTKSDNGSAVGRAVVGGLVAGGVGAVIGGSTGKKNTTIQQEEDIVVHNYTVLITTKNVSSPLIRINVGEKEQLACEIIATLKAIIANS